MDSVYLGGYNIMKKILSVFLSVLLICAIAVQANAANLVLFDHESFAPGSRCYIESDYYKIYYNELFEHRYKKILKDIEIYGKPELELTALSEYIPEDSYVYMTIIFNDKDDDTGYREYNLQCLSQTFAQEDILYVGDTTPMAVVKLHDESVELLYENKSILGITQAFYDTNLLINMIVGTKNLGDVVNDSNVTAADARFVLRFSAGLETVSMYAAKKFYFSADMNMDGHITSADARLILRTAAGLEKVQKIGFPYAACWNDFA